MAQPPTNQEREAAQREWQARQKAPAAPASGAVMPAAPTAWQSLPSFIRFAVWLWAIGTVVTVGLGWLVAAVWMGLR